MDISSGLAYNRAFMKKAFSQCFEAAFRDIDCFFKKKALIVFMDGLSDRDFIEKSVIEPLLGFGAEVLVKNARDVADSVLSGVDLRSAENMEDAIYSCLSGDAAVFIDGFDEAFVVQTRKWAARSVSEPETQRTVRGPREGFTETLLTNVAMIRRKLKTPSLKTEIKTLGNISRTDVCLLYVEGIADERLIRRIKKRLSRVDADYILESGHIEQLIEDDHKTLFSTTGNSEKPDAVAAKLLKGRAALIIDGTPFALTAPMLFSENFQSPEDYYTRPFYANFLRALRYFAYFVTLTFPAFYTALLTFYRDMIPDRLLSTLVLSSDGAPMGIAVEMFLLLTVYELLREAMLRLPASVGASVGLVGVFIIGDAAVSVKLIGAPTVVVCAVTFITSAVVTPLTDSSALIRFAFLILSAFLGAYGIFLGLFILLARLSALTSYGCPYLFPMAPFDFKGVKTSVFRGDIKDIIGRREN